jgi:hypothetical protein
MDFVEVPKEHQRGFLFSPFFAFPWFQEWSVSLLLKSAKTCQYYFIDFSIASLRVNAVPYMNAEIQRSTSRLACNYLQLA